MAVLSGRERVAVVAALALLLLALAITVHGERRRRERSAAAYMRRVERFITLPPRTPCHDLYVRVGLLEDRMPMTAIREGDLGGIQMEFCNLEELETYRESLSPAEFRALASASAWRGTR